MRQRDFLRRGTGKKYTMEKKRKEEIMCYGRTKHPTLLKKKGISRHRKEKMDSTHALVSQVGKKSSRGGGRTPCRRRLPLP